MKHLLEQLQFDPVHRPCRCIDCCTRRLLRVFADMDLKYGPKTAAAPPKETLQ